MKTTAFFVMFWMGTVVHAADEMPKEPALRKMASRFANVDISTDVSKLSDGDKQVLAKLIRAAKIMDSLFLDQVWSGNRALLLDLVADPTPLGKTRLNYFLLNKGPWSRIDQNMPFIPGVPAKPPQGNFYAAGTTKEEIDTWVKALPEADRTKAAGFFNTIRKTPAGKLATVAYSIEFQGELEQAANLLIDAAKIADNPSLKDYLQKRAEAFLSNDYYASDLAWMGLDSVIEPVIGPYEVYEDEWFNQKAAFEAFITLRDDAETAKLAKLGTALQDIENNLPIAPGAKNPQLGSMAPIRVVNSIFSSGDGNRGVQTAAFNLPNDERITKEKGSKRVMLKNIQQAKFKLVLMPISKVALAPPDRKNVTFDAFFTHILMHELMHGLGPHTIKVQDKTTTVREQLQDYYSAIEEAKADISGLWAMQYLIDKGQLDKSLQKSMYTTFLASAFRSIRFGINEAHGKGVAMQLNYLSDAGAIKINKNGTFAVVEDKIKDAVTSLTRELMTLQADGNRAGAQALLDRLAVVRPETQKILSKLARVPVDIAPRFGAAGRLLSQAETSVGAPAASK